MKSRFEESLRVENSKSVTPEKKEVPGLRLESRKNDWIFFMVETITCLTGKLMRTAFGTYYYNINNDRNIIKTGRV